MWKSKWYYSSDKVKIPADTVAFGDITPGFIRDSVYHIYDIHDRALLTEREDDSGKVTIVQQTASAEEKLYVYPPGTWPTWFLRDSRPGIWPMVTKRTMLYLEPDCEMDETRKTYVFKINNKEHAEKFIVALTDAVKDYTFEPGFDESFFTGDRSHEAVRAKWKPQATTVLNSLYIRVEGIAKAQIDARKASSSTPSKPSSSNPSQPSSSNPSRPITLKPPQPTFSTPSQPSFPNPSQPSASYPIQQRYADPSMSGSSKPSKPGFSSHWPGFGDSSSRS